MSADMTLEDALVTNWGRFFHGNGTLRPRVTVALDCQICSTPLAIDHAADDGHEAYTVLLCGHAIGVRCMRRWVAENPTCPICRKRLKHPGCGHVGLPIFEHRAGYNIHHPPFGVIGPSDGLNLLCVVCDGRVQAGNLSDQVPELEQSASQAMQGPAGESNILLGDSPWQVLDGRPLYELYDAESTEEALVQDVMNLSLRDQVARMPQASADRHQDTNSRRSNESLSGRRHDHRRHPGESSTGHRYQHRHGHSRASSDSDEVEPITPPRRNSGAPELYSHTHHDHRSRLRDRSPLVAPIERFGEESFTGPYAPRAQWINPDDFFMHPYGHVDNRDNFFARPGAPSPGQSRFLAELQRIHAQENQAGAQESLIRRQESRTGGRLRPRPGDLLYRDGDGNWWRGVRD
ncbi:hypothetical protein F5Y18DRAFT_425374 [Xylariaceae sp. FL1019]|nr:hypothetical protein F5Y18DRAFT_425374 [Xylariaceae sp. FL1019]